MGNKKEASVQVQLVLHLPNAVRSKKGIHPHQIHIWLSVVIWKGKKIHFDSLTPNLRESVLDSAYLRESKWTFSIWKQVAAVRSHCSLPGRPNQSPPGQVKPQRQCRPNPAAAIAILLEHGQLSFSTTSITRGDGGGSASYIRGGWCNVPTYLPGRGRRPIKKGRGLDQWLALHLVSALVYHLPKWESGRHNLW